MGFFSAGHKGMDWFERMSLEEQAAYLGKSSPNAALLQLQQPSDTSDSYFSDVSDSYFSDTSDDYFSDVSDSYFSDVSDSYFGEAPDNDFIDIQGSAGFQRQMQRYIEQVCKSSEGYKVFCESGLTGIRQTNGVNSFCNGSVLELGMFGGYAVFCHELRHCWQQTQGWDMGDWNHNENDANAWSAARCAEAGDLLGAAFGAFMIVEPLSKLTNMVYYNR